MTTINTTLGKKYHSVYKPSKGNPIIILALVASSYNIRGRQLVGLKTLMVETILIFLKELGRWYSLKYLTDVYTGLMLKNNAF